MYTGGGKGGPESWRGGMTISHYRGRQSLLQFTNVQRGGSKRHNSPSLNIHLLSILLTS